MEKLPRALGRSLVVYEVDRDRNQPPEWVRVTVSSPGRDGTFSRTWQLDRGSMDPAVFTDMHTFIAKGLLDGVVMLIGGIQGRIDVGAAVSPAVTDDAIGRPGAT